MHLKAESALAILLTIGGVNGAAYAQCIEPPPLPSAPHVEVNDAKELAMAIDALATGGHRHIVLAPGVYDMPRPAFLIQTNDVTIRGLTGERDDVTVRGQGMRGATRQIFQVYSKNFTLRDLTLGWVSEHAVQIKGENDADSPRFINLRFVNTGQQMLKISGGNAIHASDNGLVLNSLFEFPSGVASHNYTGGIDAHQTQNWHVEANTFKHIRSPNQILAEHAIHFWSGAVGTKVVRNTIINADRGIGFGLGGSTHDGGVIQNNFVHVTKDVGIGLENSPNTYIAHNTVVIRGGYPNAIEYRFPATTGGTIAHNLTIGAIASRDGGEANLVNNVDYAQPTWLADVDNGDLHLVKGVPNVRGKAQHTLDIQRDIDCDFRTTLEGVDIGADQTRLAIDESLAVPVPNPVVKELKQTLSTTQDKTTRIISKLRSEPKLILFALAGSMHFLLMLWLIWQISKLRKVMLSLARRDSERPSSSRASTAGSSPPRSSKGLPKTLR